MDCGPSCLRMIAKYYGKSFSLQTLRERSYITRQGVSFLGISDAAESLGFRSIGVLLSLKQLLSEAPKPLIIHWKQNHFIVVYKTRRKKVFVADPALGKITYTVDEFAKNWLSTKEDGESKGLAMLLEPTPEFYAHEGEKVNRAGFRFLYSYIKPYKRFVYQLLIGMIVASLLQLIFPFLTQAIVDFGISNQDKSFIFLILLAQLILIISRTSVDFIRGWILLHLSTRINISLISDFLIKLMKLPISFFDTKVTGDLLQRINDHKRVELFMTTSSLEILFSFFNLLIFGVVLGIYSLKILTIFIIGSLIYFFWVSAFMSKRRELDLRRFSNMAENQERLIQIINGMEEIKINNADKNKRWEWEGLQASLFKINIRNLSLHQYQQAGGVLINEIKNILITFIAATAVVNNSMTLGMMMAISYILGQLNSPIERTVQFLRTAQDAKISLERLSEIHENKNEEEEDKRYVLPPTGKNIRISKLSFRYEGPNSKKVLDDINLDIKENSVTAIVGVSGSGKTTLIKLLLGYYNPTEGEIRIGDQSMQTMSHSRWRDRCGVVLQNGYLFSDSIAGNIALGFENIDPERLINAANIANIDDFINQLPLGYNTKIGQSGQTLSGGEKQRVLIARSVYKDPDFFFIDEGTSSLDANNEKEIMEKLEKFYEGKTVIIVAHRLSTVKNADQIIVLDKGKIVEKGNHKELTAKKGAYYKLVKNQLEMGEG